MAETTSVEKLKQGTGVPLFCFHSSGGLALPYQPLGDYLDCPIIGIRQAAGAERQSIRTMAAHLADQLQLLHPGGPYNLLGWSLGGVIAHEVAIELSQRGCVVRRLVLLDAVPDHGPGQFDGDMVIFFTTQYATDWDLPLQSWRPYVAGDITALLVDCPHLEMLSPESIDMYGRQLKLLLEP